MQQKLFHSRIAAIKHREFSTLSFCSLPKSIEMAKRKALSAEEKRHKLLELFHETCDVFQLKDLERLAPKEKGIVLQSVKGTLQELVDSGEVCSEKIAGSIYFWAFPSEALNATTRLLEESEQQNVQLQSKIEEASKQLQEVTTTVNDAEAAEALLREIGALKQEKEALQRRVAATATDIDYDKVRTKERDIKKITEAANRWTDNIFSTKTWCKRKFDKEDRELNKAFGIPEDLDYLDV